MKTTIPERQNSTIQNDMRDEKKLSPRSAVLLLTLLVGTGLGLHSCTTESPAENREAHTIYQAVEELRIGRLEGEPEYTFGRVSRIATGKNGTIFVADNQVPVIRMYNSEGHYLRNVGREGQGPGEYQSIRGMQTLPDGRLAVSDNSMRINVYDPEGHFLEEHESHSRLSGSQTFQTDQNGNFYVLYVVRNTPDMPNWEVEWQKLSPEGQVIDTIKVPLDEEEREMSFTLFTASGRATPFVEEPMSWMSSLGYLITGRNDRYAFTLNLSDAPPIQVERAYPPVRVTSEERSEWEAWKSYYKTNNIIPDIKPAYKAIRTDSQGRVWIWRYVESEYTEKRIGPDFGPDSRWWERPEYDIFLPDGSFHATVLLPWNASFRDARDNLIWAVVQGDYSEQYVARLRMVEVTD